MKPKTILAYSGLTQTKVVQFSEPNGGEGNKSQELQFFKSVVGHFPECTCQNAPTFQAGMLQPISWSTLTYRPEYSGLQEQVGLLWPIGQSASTYTPEHSALSSLGSELQLKLKSIRMCLHLPSIYTTHNLFNLASDPSPTPSDEIYTFP